MRRKKKKGSVKDLSNASPAEVAKAFAGEVRLLTKEAAEDFDGEILSSELRSLDEAIGVGGFPKGRIVEIFGPESAGKTALCFHLIGKAQKAGGKGGMIDVEHAANLKHAIQVGVDVPNMLFSQPDSGEAAMSLAERMIKSRAVDVLIIDSVAQLQPLREQEKGIEGSTMGTQAALMSKSMRFLKSAALKNNVLLVFTNQLRMKIGVMFGNPETTPGGLALRFAADIRIRISHEGFQKKKGKIIGLNSKLRIVKNKVGIPFQNARLRLVYGRGWRSLKIKEESE
jgi:recombination protein RecA